MSFFASSAFSGDGLVFVIASTMGATMGAA